MPAPGLPHENNGRGAMFFYIRVRVDLTEEGARALREARGLTPAEPLREAVCDEVFAALDVVGTETGYWQQVRVT